MTTAEEMLHAEDVRALPLRERIGLVIDSVNAKETIQSIVEAEKAGVRQIWTTQGPGSVDALTVFAVAATQTTAIRMGTSILPTYPRHPLALVAQAQAFYDLAPGRLRLGIGASHRPTIEGVYGIKMTAALAHTREYLVVLRTALWEGTVDYHGRFFNVTANLPRTARVPLLVSALGAGAFQAAGELADGALSWNCPVPYLLKTALPALQKGAKEEKRAAPPLVAHVPVAVSTDRAAVFNGARKRMAAYGRLPFYRNMFAEAGYPVPEDGTIPDALIEGLVVSGDDQTIAARLSELLSNGLDELLVLNIPIENAAQEWERLAHIIGGI